MPLIPPAISLLAKFQSVCKHGNTADKKIAYTLQFIIIKFLTNIKNIPTIHYCVIKKNSLHGHTMNIWLI